jgi:outer membrane protein TolC
VVADLDDAEQRRVAASGRVDLSDRTLVVSKSQLDAETWRFKTGTGTALQVRVAEDQVRTTELRTSVPASISSLPSWVSSTSAAALVPRFAR